MSASLADVRALDASDPLAPVRQRFALPKGVIYLDGNSLGAAPVAVRGRLDAAIAGAWGEGLVRSWNDADGISAPARVGGKIAPLIGADADEVTVADSTSVNLYKLMVAALRSEERRVGKEC